MESAHLPRGAVSRQACSSACERTAGCMLAVWRVSGVCHLKRTLKPMSVHPEHGRFVWLSQRMANAHAKRRFRRRQWNPFLSPRQPYPVTCSPGVVAANKKVVWTYWHTHPAPDVVLAIVHAWRMHSPTWTVRLLDQHTIKCYLPDLQYLTPPIKTVPLLTDIIRLSLLTRYGGVWLDASVVIFEPLDAIVAHTGFHAVVYPDYVTPGVPDDFVESWFLAANQHSYIAKTWLSQLLQVVVANNGTFKGISSSPIYSRQTNHSYTKIAEMIGGKPNYWSEYLVVYVCFTWLYHNDAKFRRLVRASQLYRANEVGYAPHHRYGWNMGAINRALSAPYGTHTYHDKLQRTRMIKLSSNNIWTLNLDIESFFNNVTRCGVRKVNVSQTGPSLWKSGVRFAWRRWTFKMVMCRHLEDLSWSYVYTGARVVYDKGGDERALLAEQSLTLYDEYVTTPDVGSECMPYLRYVIDNYDLLPRYVAFTQGGLGPENAWVRPKDFGATMFNSMLREARRDGCSKPHTSDPTALDGDWTFAYNGTDESDATTSVRRTSDFRQTSHDFGAWFHHVMKLGAQERRDPIRQLSFYPGAHMVVSRANILSRSRRYYERMIEQVDHSARPLECRYFERAWYYIFNCDHRFEDQPHE